MTSQLSPDIGGGTILTSTVTSDAVAEPGIQVGRKASAAIEASRFMLATDWPA